MSLLDKNCSNSLILPETNLHRREIKALKHPRLPVKLYLMVHILLLVRFNGSLYRLLLFPAS